VSTLKDLAGPRSGGLLELAGTDIASLSRRYNKAKDAASQPLSNKLRWPPPGGLPQRPDVRALGEAARAIYKYNR